MVILSLGSNLGDRQGHIAAGIASLVKNGFQLDKQSSVWESPPWGKTDQPVFYNAVISGDYHGLPQELLALILQIEKENKRTREIMWGPRTLDIDIIEFDNQQVIENELQIPHPRYKERLFVLIPLAEIHPEFVPSGEVKTVSELVLRFEESERAGLLRINNGKRNST